MLQEERVFVPHRKERCILGRRKEGLLEWSRVKGVAEGDDAGK